MSREDIEVDEDLPNFFEAVKLSASEELCSENDNMMKHFGFEFSDPDTMSKLQEAQIPKKALQGTPWYQILSNYCYADRFQYIGKSVPEREKLIDDGYEEAEEGEELPKDGSGDEATLSISQLKQLKLKDPKKITQEHERRIAQQKRNNRHKFEQSDMVMILLNLSYIPDDVVKRIRFDEPGWSEQFLEHMEEYKRKFFEEHKMPWT